MPAVRGIGRSIRFLLPASLLALVGTVVCVSATLGLRQIEEAEVDRSLRDLRRAAGVAARTLAALGPDADVRAVGVPIERLRQVTGAHRAGILDTEGRWVVFSDADHPGRGRGVPEERWALSALAAPDGVAHRVLHPEMRIQVAARVGPPSSAKLVVFLDAGAEPMLGWVHRQGARYFQLLAVVGLLSVAFAIWMLHRGVARPARRLADAADRLADGDLSARAPAGGAEELRRAGEAFNRMAGQLEDALRARAEQQRLIDALMEGLPLAVVAVSRADGRVRFVNPYWREILGLAVDAGDDYHAALAGLRWFRPDGEPLQVADLAIPSALRTGRPTPSLELVVERADGSRVPMIARSIPLSVDGASDFDTVVGIAIDRREIEHAFAELRRSERELNALLESVDVGVVMVRRSDRTVLFSNLRFHELVGAPLEVGAPLPADLWRLEASDGTPIPPARGTLSRVIETGRPATSEDVVLVTADGRRTAVSITSAPVWLSDGPDFDAIVAVIHDRSQLAMLVADLRASDDRFARALRVTGQAVYEWDIRRDVCRFSGPIETLLGWTAADLDTNGKWNALTHPEDLPAVRAAYERSVRERRPFDHVYRLRHASGSWVWVRDRADCDYDAAGNPVLLRGAVADITEQREIEAQLRHAQKLETIGTLAGGIAHDFNNQLTAVIGYLALVEEGRIPDSARDEQIRMALRAAERCAELTRGLLAFSRMLPANPRTCSVNAIVEETASLMRRMLPAGIVLLVDLDPAAPWVRADPGQIQQALFNLCTNARDAMGEFGTLRLSTRRARAGAAGAEDEEEAAVEIEVSDTGTGIAPEILPRMFEPFFSTKPVGKGTGLGLAMVYGIVSQHGGRVDVESTPGRGSTFVVRLPAFRPADGRLPAEPAAESLPGDLRRRVVLVVDDEPAVLAYAESVLASAGCTVLRASDGDQALARLAEDPTYVELVLLDLTMPGTPVPLVVRGMRQLVPGLPIVLTSGFASDTGARAELPNLPFLPKPYRPAQLLRLLSQVLAGAPTAAPSA